MSGNNRYTIFSQKMAGYLMTKGFPLIKLGQDRKSSRNVFIFNDGDELRKAMELYSRKDLILNTKGVQYDRCSNAAQINKTI